MTTYYWRVDEILVDGAAKTGAVRSLTTGLPVDDFESYTDKAGNEMKKGSRDRFHVIASGARQSPIAGIEIASSLRSSQ